MPGKSTIAALATPAGEGAVALLRISGPLSESITEEVFARKSPPPPRKAILGTYTDVAGHPLDQALYTYYTEGASYTGESTLEIACHGNPLIAQKILEDLQERGCRLAEPGEFTRSAFLNQRMDLSQAEAVMELIQAKSEKAIEVAQRHLRGGLGDRIRKLTQRLIRLCAQLEAYIDFPEEDLPDEDEEGPRADLAGLIAEVHRLIETNRFHESLTQGFKLAILGAPNAGKSSLLNALLDRDRAIVSKTPGTTRDFITEQITYGALNLEVIDTAGLRDGGSEIEKLGMERTIDIAKQADFNLLVIDSADTLPALPQDLLEGLSPENTVVAENKADLESSKDLQDYLPALPHCRISVKAGDGMKALKELLHTNLNALVELPGEETVIINSRHKKLLDEGHGLLRDAQLKLESGSTEELAANDLRAALEAISSITGTAGTEDILDSIFQNFCIGK